MKNGILAGKTVLELGSMIAAPFATHILQQLGATVIKIEPPAGETTRKLVRGGPSGSYLAFNRGKKSLCLDLQSDQGRAVFRRLIEDCDIVVHNLSPSAARKLGATYQDCIRLNPEIIFCHIKGYGAGPLEEEVASNPIAEAATGVMFSNRVNGRPSRLGPSYHDQFAGCYAVIAVLSALLSDDPAKRNIELGLYETGLHIAARDLLGVQLKSQLLGRPETEPSAEFSIPGYGAYETRDKRWIYLVMLTDDHWRKFCAAAGIAPDPTLAGLRDRRRERPRVEEMVATAVGAEDYDVLTEKLSRQGVGFTEILSADRVLAAPQAMAGDKVSEFVFGDYDFASPDFPIPALLRTQGRADAPPLLGEDTAEILRTLGYDEGIIETMIEAGAALTARRDRELWSKPKTTARAE
ncbi:CaiB/BaiF CoA transferase family protein [Martelella radicis]|uniref:Crotonobetainyl-CoA:carnitine CoA-transferase CaiB-like acyl-CoA transferase n=1 Tax=Martelella radicis TaxID=1397476 RepID=A0A7W6PAR4_9HYPH|nr:CaiB/BaiF CoA-transferase family protein [Martelella radicis]MBB4122651.1 crotonobetainyl-CoA:carnitine CoA-transferase CaiB-like acyl-CoA transferase [Martelella radicis]